MEQYDTLASKFEEMRHAHEAHANKGLPALCEEFVNLVQDFEGRDLFNTNKRPRVSTFLAFIKNKLERGDGLTAAQGAAYLAYRLRLCNGD
jgi:hypothetical protein